MNRALPADQAVRDRLRNDLDSTFFVEAGAGTGKTTAVVLRIAELVAKARLDIRGLIAVTFTEAAAAELRARVREALEDASRDIDRPDGERQRCVQAVARIEDATIDTIHAFAAMILRTFPLEAGLPPGFDVMEPIEEQLEFHDRFRLWFDEVANSRHREVVRRCLLLGLQPKDIRLAARGLQDQYDLLTRDMLWPSASRDDALEVAHSVGRQLRSCLRLLQYGPGVDDAVRAINSVQPLADRLIAASDEDQALGRLAEGFLTPGIGKSGRQREWGTDAASGDNALTVLRAIHAEAVGEAREVVASYRGAVLAQLLGLLTTFALDWAADRKVDGRATFHDLLTWARDVVRDNGEVRSKLQARFSHIFVDEFQDTDPLQAELVMYLSAASVGELPTDWRSITPTPGKLFIVGDPKQSIYRFRRADIALYQTIQDSLGNLEKLTSNFRSVPAVIDLVNNHFSRRIVPASGSQPDYTALTAEQPAGGAAIWSFGGVVDGTQTDVWQAEATGLACIARRAIDDGWRVSATEAGVRILRPATFRDVTMLIPSRGNLGRIERALTDADIPFRLESGELVLATQEIRDLLSALRAIDDPSDQVALVAALRAPTYGCSDVELLRWTETGGRLTYEYAAPSAEGEGVRTALADLLEWHGRRHALSVGSLIEQFIDARLLAVAALANNRSEDYLRRYRHVVERSRTFAKTRRSTLRAFLDWMDDLRDENQLALPGPPESGASDAVRIMTVHGAKGLEFPIVLMSGWHSRRNFNAPTAIPDRVASKVHVACGPNRVFATPGYGEAKDAEAALNNAEGVRLVYVAATRARDHLVVSLCRAEDKLRAEQKREGQHLAETLVRYKSATHLDTDLPTIRKPALTDSITVGTGEGGQESEAAWLDQRAAFLRDYCGLKLVTATGLAHLPETSSAPETPATEVAALRRGRGATSLGRAVHAVLQVIELESLDRLSELSRAQAAIEGIPDMAPEIERLARTAAESPAVRRAVGATSYWREVPIGVRLGDSILEGYIDLAFDTGDGIEIVDYKTDRVAKADVAARMNQYEIQGEAYRMAIEEASGRPVPRVTFVFAHLGDEATIEPDPARRQRLLDRV